MIASKSRTVFATFYYLVAGFLLVFAGFVIQKKQAAATQDIKQNTLLRSILVGSDSVVITLDTEGVIDTITPAVTEFTGFSREDLLGKHPEDILMPETYKLAHQVSYQRAVETLKTSDGQLKQVFCQVKKKDGTTQQVVNTVIWSPEGAMAILTPINAITTRSRLMEIALNLAKVGVWWWQVDKDELIWDARMKEFFEVGDDDILDYRSFERRVHPDDIGWVNKIVQKCIADRGEYEAVFRIIRKDGSLRYIRTYGKVFDDPSGTVFAGVNIQVNADEYTGRPEPVGSGIPTP